MVVMSGRTVEVAPDEGWSWKELDRVDETAGGAPLAQRNALKLLAVLIQHGSNKDRAQLTDAQLHELFDVARFTQRDRDTSVDDWVSAFKQKRAEIVDRRCAP